MSETYTQPLLFDPPIKSWSYTALKQFEKCPFSLYLARVARAPAPERTEAHPAVRGERVHEDAELFVKGERTLTKELRKVAHELDKFREAYKAGEHIELEQQWAFREDWSPTDWHANDCWARIKCDLVWHKQDPGVIEVTDYKTGKSFGNELAHNQQLQVYAIATFMRYSHAKLVVARLIYIDEGRSKEVAYTRPQALVFLPRITERAKRLTEATTFPVKPNKSNCRFCDFGVENGTGVCPYAVAG